MGVFASQARRHYPDLQLLLEEQIADVVGVGWGFAQIHLASVVPISGLEPLLTLTHTLIRLGNMLYGKPP